MRCDRREQSACGDQRHLNRFSHGVVSNICSIRSINGMRGIHRIVLMLPHDSLRSPCTMRGMTLRICRILVFYGYKNATNAILRLSAVAVQGHRPYASSHSCILRIQECYRCYPRLPAVTVHNEGLCPSASVEFLYPADTRMLRMLPRGSLRSPYRGSAPTHP